MLPPAQSHFWCKSTSSRDQDIEEVPLPWGLCRCSAYKLKGSHSCVSIAPEPSTRGALRSIYKGTQQACILTACLSCLPLDAAVIKHSPPEHRRPEGAHRHWSGAMRSSQRCAGFRTLFELSWDKLCLRADIIKACHTQETIRHARPVAMGLAALVAAGLTHWCPPAYAELEVNHAHATEHPESFVRFMFRELGSRNAQCWTIAGSVSNRHSISQNKHRMLRK